MAGNKNTVQGMNVVLDGDNKGINQSLTSMNKEIKTSSKLAQDLNKNLTFDDEGIKNLNKQLGEVENQIDLTKKKQEQLLQKLAQTDQGTVEYKKLESEIEKTKTTLNKLDKVQVDLNKDIKAMETGNFDELSKRSKNASASMKELGEDTKTAGNENNKFNELIDTSIGLITPWTAAVASAGLALVVFKNDLSKTNSSMREFNKLTLDMDTTSQDFEHTARMLSRTLGIDYEPALESVVQTQKIFNDYIKDGEDLMGLSIVTLDLLATGYLSTEELQSSLSISTGVFNLSLEDSIDVMYREIKMMDKYGTRADDINDSYREFGDTMKMAGADEDDFFRIMEDGLKAGAKNTDEVVNSTNEYIIKLADATDATKQAYEDIGLSFDEVRTDMTNGDVEGAMLDTAVALEDAYVKVAEKQGIVMANAWLMAETGNIWGTPGEEFIAPWISKDAEDGVNNTALYAQNLDQINIQNEKLKPINLTIKTGFETQAGDIMGLSGQQILAVEEHVDTLSEKFGVLAPAVYLASLAFAGEEGSLDNSLYLALNMGLISAEQMPNIVSAYGTLKTEGLLTAKSQAILGIALKWATDKMFLTTNQTELLKTKYLELQGQEEAFTTVQNFATIGTVQNALALERVDSATETLLESNSNLMVQQGFVVDSNGRVSYSNELVESSTGRVVTNTQELNIESATLKEKLDFLAGGLFSTTGELDTYNTSMAIMKDDTSTTEEKTKALLDVMSILNEEGLAQNTDWYKKLNPLLQDSAKYTENSAKMQEKSAQALKGTKGDGLNDQLDKESRFAGDASGSTDELVKSLEGLETQAGYDNTAGAMKDLNSEIDKYNGKTLNDKSTTVTTTTQTQGSGQGEQQPITGQSFSVNPSQMVSTQSFATPQQMYPETYNSQSRGNSVTANVNLSIVANTTSPYELAQYVGEEVTTIVNENLGRRY